LLEKDTPWHFEAKQENAVKRLKEMVTSAPVLKYFNPKDLIKVTSDSSKFGLGAVLEQREEGKWKPVAFASRSLTQSEQTTLRLKRRLSVLYLLVRNLRNIYMDKTLLLKMITSP
jgi:hypothetical protein